MINFDSNSSSQLLGLLKMDNFTADKSACSIYASVNSGQTEGCLVDVLRILDWQYGGVSIFVKWPVEVLQKKSVTSKKQF